MEPLNTLSCIFEDNICKSNKSYSKVLSLIRLSMITFSKFLKELLVNPLLKVVLTISPKVLLVYVEFTSNDVYPLVFFRYIVPAVLLTSIGSIWYSSTSS